MTIRRVWLTCVVALMLAAAVRAEIWEARATGEHMVTASDTPEIAQQLATLDATRKLLTVAAARLSDASGVKDLHMTDVQMAAYVAGVVDLADPPRVVREGTLVRAEMVARLDLADAARRIDLAHKEGEVSVDLIDTWNRIGRLQAQIVTDTRAVSIATAANRAGAVEARRQALTSLRANFWLAQASGALIREETGTTSIAIVTPEGRVRARQLVEKALALDAGNGDVHARMGDVLLVEGAPEKAELEYREAVRQEPGSGVKHNKLGNALYAQGRLQDAAAQLTEAIRLNPADAISHSDLGDTLKAQRNITGAIAEYREAIRLDGGYVSARHSLGITLASQQRVPEALAEFQEAVRLRPSSALAHYNAAIALADLEKDEESAKEWREAVRLNPNNYNAHYNLGEMLRLIGELKESATAFREYVSRAPDTPATQRNKQRARTFIEAFEEP